MVTFMFVAELAARVGIATGLVVVGDLAGEGAAQEQAVVGDTPNLAARLQGVTHVFQLAAQAGVRRSWGKEFQVYTGLNVDSTQRLLEACVGRPIERLVYASSSSVYGDGVPLPMKEASVLKPVSPYGVTKLAAEQLCYLYFVNHGVPTVSLRYFTVYGPRQRPDMAFARVLGALADGRAFPLYGDGSKRQKKHQAMLQALQRRDRVITGGGIYGTVVSADGDVITLRVADNVKLQVARSAVAGLATDAANVPLTPNE